MRKTGSMGLLVGVLLLASGATFANTGKTGIQFEHITLEQALEKATAEKKLIFIDVFATWCGPCKYLSADVFPDAELGEYYNEQFICLKVDGEKGEGPEIMSRFELDSYPTLLFLDSQGNLLRKRVGASGPGTLLQWGRDVVTPEESELFMLQKLHKRNPGSRRFMAELMNTMVAEGLNPDTLADEYLHQYPQLDLTDDYDFIAFLHSNSNLGDSLVEEFLIDIQTMEFLHGEMVGDKVLELLNGQIANAVEQRNQRLLTKSVETLYPAYRVAFAEEAFSKEELLDRLETMYQDMVL